MRPSVFTAAPTSCVLYCQFEVLNQLIDGRFASGCVRSENPTERDSQAINIPIVKLESKREEKNPNEASHGTALPRRQ